MQDGWNQSAEMSPSALQKLGLAAAELVAGDGAVERVDVTSGEDRSEQPVYYFTFLIDFERARQRPGLVLTRLVQKLRDDLIARGDGHYPVIEMLNKVDWASRADAKSL